MEYLRHTLSSSLQADFRFDAIFYLTKVGQVHCDLKKCYFILLQI